MYKHKTKILHAMRQGQIGGGESHVYDLVTNLNKSEFEPIVLSFTDGPIIDKLRRQKITVYVVDTIQPFHFATFNNVQAIMRSEEIDIVHAHGTRALSNTIFTAKALGLPVIYTVYGWAFHRDQLLHRKLMREFSEKLLTSNVDLTIHVASSTTSIGNAFSNKKNTTTINYGVNLDIYSPYRPIKDIRSELGLSTTKTTIGYFDRLTSQRDPFCFIRAIAKIKNSCNDLQFLMVGEGDLKKACIQMADKLEINHLITFHDAVDSKQELWKAMDIYCSTSITEGLKPELMEAMAMHKAIIATNTASTMEFVKDNWNGLIYAGGEDDRLAGRLLRIANDVRLRDAIGENAYQTIHKKFDLSRTVAENESIYHSFMHKRMSA